MIAAAVEVSSFLPHAGVFVFSGDTPYSILEAIHKTEDLHKFTVKAAKLLPDLGWAEWRTICSVGTAFFDHEDVEPQELKKYLGAVPELCRLLEFLEADNAGEILAGKYLDGCPAAPSVFSS